MSTHVLPPAATGAPSLAIARVAVSSIFFILGCGTGVWAVHIPIVVERLAIDHATVGLALFTAAAGAVGTMPITGIALGRFGSRVPTAALACAFAILAPLPVAAQSVPFLFVALLFFGAAMGGLDVAMNVQASEIETARGKPTMSSFHAFYSIGLFAGSAVGGLVIARGWANGDGATGAALVLLALAIWAARNLWPSVPSREQRPRFALPPVAVLGLGAITFLAFSAEGAVTDWSALYMSTVKGSDLATAATGVALFSVAMVLCRLTGDRVVAALGAPAIVLGGGILVTAGMLLAVLSPWPLVVAVAFGIVGIGAANLVPASISAAARMPDVPSGIAVASVTSMGYAGFLIVPPILGFVAKWLDLSASLVLVALMGVAIVALTGAVRTRH